MKTLSPHSLPPHKNLRLIKTPDETPKKTILNPNTNSKTSKTPNRRPFGEPKAQSKFSSAKKNDGSQSCKNTSRTFKRFNTSPNKTPIHIREGPKTTKPTPRNYVKSKREANIYLNTFGDARQKLISSKTNESFGSKIKTLNIPTVNNSLKLRFNM